MKLYSIFKQLLTRCSSCVTFTLVAGSLLLPGHADTFTIDGVETEWPTSGSVTVNDVTESATTIVVDGKEATSTTLCTGYAVNSDVSANTTEVSNSKLGNVYGTRVSGNGNASNNHVDLTASSVSSFVIGAYITSTGEATGNTVSATDCKDGHSLKNVYGAYVGSNGAANYNEITITNSSTTGSVMGGYTASDGQADHNTVTISGSTATGTVYGGYAKGVTANAKGASHNTVAIENSTTAALYGGRTLYGTDNEPLGYGDASWNTVSVKNSTVGQILAGATIEGEASHNTIIIDNSTVTSKHVMAGTTTNGNSTHNTVILRGDCDLSGSEIYGGDAAAGYDSTTGNTLTLDHFSGSIRAIKNFDTINIMIDDWEEDATIVSVGNFTSIGHFALTLDFSALNTDVETRGQMTLISGLNAGSVLDDWTITVDGVSYESLANFGADSDVGVFLKTREDGSKDLVMITGVPEPTTATLSLLALAALAARRRRK